jgi:hypothetical protein
MSTAAKKNVVVLQRIDGLPGGYRQRRARWYVPQNAPKDAEDLTFTARDSEGRFSWWDVTLPKTDYWAAHAVLGRAYAFELLDLINNPKAEYHKQILAFIVEAQMRWRGNDPCGGAIVHGFHEVLSEYLATGTANR